MLFAGLISRVPIGQIGLGGLFRYRSKELDGSGGLGGRFSSEVGFFENRTVEFSNRRESVSSFIDLR